MSGCGECDKKKKLKEMSATGGAAFATPGTGDGIATKKAFRKMKVRKPKHFQNKKNKNKPFGTKLSSLLYEILDEMKPIPGGEPQVGMSFNITMNNQKGTVKILKYIEVAGEYLVSIKLGSDTWKDYVTKDKVREWLKQGELNELQSGVKDDIFMKIQIKADKVFSRKPGQFNDQIFYTLCKMYGVSPDEFFAWRKFNTNNTLVKEMKPFPGGNRVKKIGYGEDIMAKLEEIGACSFNDGLLGSTNHGVGYYYANMPENPDELIGPLDQVATKLASYEKSFEEMVESAEESGYSKIDVTKLINQAFSKSVIYSDIDGINCGLIEVDKSKKTITIYALPEMTEVDTSLNWDYEGPAPYEFSDDGEEVIKVKNKDQINESLSYNKFKSQAKTKNNQAAFHSAVKEIKKRISEVNKILEYTNKMRTELSEDKALKYSRFTEKALGQLTTMIAELYGNLKQLKK